MLSFVPRRLLILHKRDLSSSSQVVMKLGKITWMRATCMWIPPHRKLNHPRLIEGFLATPHLTLLCVGHLELGLVLMVTYIYGGFYASFVPSSYLNWGHISRVGDIILSILDLTLYILPNLTIPFLLSPLLNLILRWENPQILGTIPLLSINLDLHISKLLAF